MRRGETEPENSSRPGRRRIIRRLLRGFAWTAGGLVAAILLVAILLVNLVHVSSVHRYLISLAEREASARLGAPVTLENFALHLPQLRVDLYGVTIEGAGSHPSPPLLQVNHIEASLRMISLLDMKLDLNRVEVDHPVVRVFEERGGGSNLPKLRATKGQAQPGLFAFTIRHALLRNGEVYFHNKPRAIEADLHDLRVHTDYVHHLHRYEGTLAYRNGHLRYGSIRSIPHRFDASFSISPKQFVLEHATLVSGQSKLSVTGNLTDYSNPKVQAKYRAVIDSSQFGELLHGPVAPSGVIRATGALQYQRAGNRPLLDSLSVEGSATSTSIRLRGAKVHISARNIGVHYSLADGTAALRDFHAAVLGGTVTADGAVESIGHGQHAHIRAALEGLSLAKANDMLVRSGTAPPVAVKGKLNAKASASWGKTLNDLVATVDATIKGQLTQRQQASKRSSSASAAKKVDGGLIPAAIPVKSVLRATYRRQDQLVKISHSYLQMPQTQLTLNGAISKKSNLAIRLQASDLRELAEIADLFRSGNAAQPGARLMLAGKARFQGNVTGPADAPQLSGHLSASSLRFDGTNWKTLGTGVYLSQSEVRLMNSHLEPEHGGRITFAGRAGLHRWSFSKSSEIDATLNASRIRMADLTRLASRPVPLTGILDAKVKLQGNEMNPRGNGVVTLTKATAYKQPVKMARVSFQATGTTVDGKLLVEVAGGRLTGNASVQPQQRNYAIQLTSTKLRLDQLQAVRSRHVKASGVLELNAKGHGSFDNPEMKVQLEASDLVIEKHTVPGFHLLVNVANHTAHASLASTVANAPIEAHATLGLKGDDVINASLNTQKISLQPLLAAYAPEMAAHISGQTEIHATVQGPLKQAAKLTAHVSIPVVSVAYDKKIKLEATSPILIDYTNGVISVQPGAIRGTYTNLQFGGSIPISGHAPTQLHLKGTVNLELAKLFNPELHSSGAVKVDVHSTGTMNAAGLGGKIEIVNANITSASLPVGLQNGNGVLTLTGNRLDVTKFEGKVGGGTITARGGVSFRPKLGFDLGMTAKDVRVLYPHGVREDMNANLRFVGSKQQSLLGGSVEITDASFTPGFDLVSLISQVSGAVAAPTAPGFSQNVRLNIAVHSANNLSLVSRTVSISGSADLFVRGTVSTPAILGRINLTGGNVIFHGDRFVLTSGTIQFVNPSQTRPVVNLALTTTIQQYNIDLRFTGPANRMRGEYTSDPSLPRADIISLLAFGQTSVAKANNAAPANQAAETLIASQVSSQVTSRISKIAGISQLSISPVLASGTTQGRPGAVITIRQQVTGNLFVTFSTNVSSTQNETIQGEYKLSPRVALSVTRPPNGGFAADVLIKRKW